MAKQKGIVKLRGTIDRTTFYKSKDGYLAKKKSTLDANRIATDPAFQKTRERATEFGRAGKSGKLLRTALSSLLANCADSRMVSRLTGTMVNVIQLDMLNNSGLRNVMDGDTKLLVGFDFNIKSKFGSTFYAPFLTTMDRETGILTISIASFIPKQMLVAPKGTTHFKIISAGAEVDFKNGLYTASSLETPILSWDSMSTAMISLEHTVSPNSNNPLFLVLGLVFYQEVNGQFCMLKNGRRNALAIAGVDVASP